MLPAKPTLLLLATLCLLCACSESPIVGDWFQSTEGCPNCQQALGYRFRADGTWSTLMRVSELSINSDLTRDVTWTGEYHCHDSRDGQTYRWQDDTLALVCEWYWGEAPGASSLCHLYMGHPVKQAGRTTLQPEEHEDFLFRVEGSTAEVGPALSFGGDADQGRTRFVRAAGLTYLGPKIVTPVDIALQRTCEIP